MDKAETGAASSPVEVNVNLATATRKNAFK